MLFSFTFFTHFGLPKALVAVMAALLMSGLLALVLKKMVSDPLEAIKKAVDRIRGGDLRYRSDLKGDDAFGALAAALNQIAEQMQGAQERHEETAREIEEIKDQKDFSDALFNNAVSGMMVLSKNGIVVRMNQAASEILELAAEKVLGRNLTDLYPEIKEMLSLNPRVAREVLVTLKSGTVRPIGFTNSLLHDTQGNERGIIIVFRDITEIKRLQSEIQKKQHFESIGKVISGVAHEIRNPLFAIQSIAQILEREIDSGQHQALIQAVLKETSRMRKLVEELLLYSRPSKLTLIDLNLDLFFEELKSYLHTKYPGIVMETTLSPSSVIKADRDRMTQVFQNLLDNAVGAHCKKIEITTETKRGVLVVSVRDDGTGVKRTDMERIFDPFFTTKKDGTGLGLPICRKIVEDHGGTLELYSGESAGATVVMTFAT